MLGTTNQWMPVTNAPGAIGFEQVITNATPGHYRILPPEEPGILWAPGGPSVEPVREMPCRTETAVLFHTLSIITHQLDCVQGRNCPV